MAASPSTIGTLVIFDRNLARHRRARAAKGLENHNFLEQHAVRDLAERLLTVNRRFARALQWGGARDGLGATAAAGKIDLLAHADITAAVLGNCRPALVGDEERLPLRDNSLDLIVSILSLHKVNDLPGALIQINRALRPDGLFLAVLPGGATLGELRHSLTAAEAEISGGASPRVSPFADVRDMGMLLQRAGFALPVVDVDHLVARYDDLPALMRDLRGMGETSILAERRREPVRRAILARAGEIYRHEFGLPDGRIPACFDMLYLTGWAPHENQPRPLAPGSAQVSLTQILPQRSDPNH